MTEPMLVLAAPVAAAAGAALARLMWPPTPPAPAPGPQEPGVVVVEEGDDGSCVLFDRPAPPPPGWTAGPGGAAWSRPAHACSDAQPPAGSPGGVGPTPRCRVPLIIGRGDRGVVTIDMATVGLLNLQGHPPSVTEFLAGVQLQAPGSAQRLAVVSGDDPDLVAVLRAEGVPVVATGRDPRPGEWRLAIDAGGEALLHPLGLAVRVPAPPPRSAVSVRVLGPVAVEGTTEAAGAKVSELIAFVALHPATTDERIKAALWPDRVPSPGTFHNTVSAARRVLGTGPDGPRFPPSEASRYRLSDEVEVDWLCLEEAAAAKDPEALRRALALVRGAPFEGKAGYHWAHEEGLSHAASADVARAALALASAASAAGDEEEAVWAARQGLRSCPGDPVLLEALGRQQAPRGGPAGGDR